MRASVVKCVGEVDAARSAVELAVENLIIPLVHRYIAARWKRDGILSVRNNSIWLISLTMIIIPCWSHHPHPSLNSSFYSACPSFEPCPLEVRDRATLGRCWRTRATFDDLCFYCSISVSLLLKPRSRLTINIALLANQRPRENSFQKMSSRFIKCVRERKRIIKMSFLSVGERFEPLLTSWDIVIAYPDCCPKSQPIVTFGRENYWALPRMEDVCWPRGTFATYFR